MSLQSAARPCLLRLISPRLRSRSILVEISNTNRSTERSPSIQTRQLSSFKQKQDQLCRLMSTVAERIAETVRDTVDHSAQAEGVTEPGLRILIFGKPGSGKGTLSARMIQKYKLDFVSVGDVLRREIMNKSEVGKEVEAVVASGGLVGDDLMLKVIQTELNKLHGRSWVLDGYPRTLEQAKLLENLLSSQGRPINMIIHLAVPDGVILKRISSRWVHLPSGRVYNTSFPDSAPRIPGKDDLTGEELVRRPDDCPETFAKRLQTYREETSPLLQYFGTVHPSATHSLSGTSSAEVRMIDPSFSYHYRPMKKEDEEDLTRYATAPPDNADGISKIWPKIEALIDGYGLQREKIRTETDVADVRAAADDLNAPGPKAENPSEKKVKQL